MFFCNQTAHIRHLILLLRPVPHQPLPTAPCFINFARSAIGSNADFYMYVAHARRWEVDNSVGDERYAEAQEVRSDAKYNLPAGAHIIYSGDWNLFNGSDENAYKCLTGQTTSDGINWSDSSAIWANVKIDAGLRSHFKNFAAHDDLVDQFGRAMARLGIYTPTRPMPGNFTNSSRHRYPASQFSDA